MRKVTEYINQQLDRSALNSFDAITASTITSRAYIDVLNNAYNAFLNINKSEEAQQN